METLWSIKGKKEDETVPYTEDEHMTCNVCGYKLHDEDTVRSYMKDNVGEHAHDIEYRCGACMDNDLY